MTQMVPVGSVDQARVLVVTAYQLARELEWRQKLSHSEYGVGLGPAVVLCICTLRAWLQAEGS